MPELPEVETVKNGLQRLIVDKLIKNATHDWPRGFPNEPEQVAAFLLGSKVSSVKRRAKVLLINLNTNYTIVIHLKMTGQLVYVGKKRFGAGHPNESLINSLPDKSTRVTFEFSDGTNLYFNDQRKFGWVKLLPTPEVFDLPFFQKVGPEPLEPEFTDKVFIDRLARRSNTTIKAAILDQTTLAGVGNIYADESLWMAKIHPATKVKNVSNDRLRSLRKAIVDVMNLSIEKGGSTDRNYVNAEGKKGSYIDFAKVFRLEGQPCQRCGTVIEKTRVAGRGTHTCPLCQIIVN